MPAFLLEAFVNYPNNRKDMIFHGVLPNVVQHLFRNDRSPTEGIPNMGRKRNERDGEKKACLVLEILKAGPKM